MFKKLRAVDRLQTIPLLKPISPNGISHLCKFFFKYEKKYKQISLDLYFIRQSVSQVLRRGITQLRDWSF